MKKRFALLATLAVLLLIAGSIYSDVLHANQFAKSNIGYGYSIIGKLYSWVTTTEKDFECSGFTNRQHVDTWSSPGDVLLEKKIAWQQWWNFSWHYRMLINITDNSGKNLTNYQVLIVLNEKNFNYSKANRNGSDIRFTFYNSSNNNETLLPYWIEKWSINNESKIWVNVEKIPANGTSTIYMYYGNENAISLSNGTATFEFFDDFEDSIIWNETGLWHTTSKKWVSYNHSKWYGQESTNDYDTGTANSGNLTSPQFQGIQNQRLELSFWREVENAGWSGYDKTVIYDSTDGNTWNQIWYNDSGNASESRWKFLSIPMNPYTNYIRFYFDTVDDLYNNYSGWFIDNVRVRKYVYPEPKINMGAEQSAQAWTDYFGGNAAISSSNNVTIANGDAELNYSVLYKIYNFSGITNPSSTNIARYDVDDGIIEPATSFNTTGNEFSNNDYAAIYQIDNNMASHATSSSSYIAQHIFRFRIEIPQNSIIKFNMSWKGHSAFLLWFFWIGFTTPDGIRLWNFSSATWDVIGDTPSSENIVSKEFYNVNDYIRNGYIYIMTYAERSNRIARIYTDYVEVNLTYASYKSNGNITSVAISPSNLSKWDKFYANASIPLGTNITYKILNASNNALLCIITSTQASNGYNISSCTGNVTSIKLYAELETNNVNYTPILHDWYVSWKTGYYKNGYLISCSYYAGNVTYHNISWNVTLPNGTTIKFQISSSPDNTTWTDFFGPDGSNTTYYEISGTNIWNGHNGDSYIKYKAYFETANAALTPVLHDVTITYYGG